MYKIGQQAKYLLLLFIFPLLLTACGKETLYEELSEKDANKMLVVLSDHSIEAAKNKVQSTDSVSYSVLVSADDIDQARKILSDYNLPRERDTQKMIEKICSAKDVISSPEWEKCRKTVSLQSQISQHFESDAVPAVVKADIIISTPKEDEFGQDPDPDKKTTASAVIRMIRTESDDKVTEDEIKKYIASAVGGGMSPRDVSVIISYINDPKMTPKTPEAPSNGTKVAGGPPLSSMLGLEMLPASASRLKIYLIVFLLFFLLMGAVVVFNVIKMTKLRQELKVTKANVAPALPGGDVPPSLEEGREGRPEQLAAAEEKVE